MNYYYFAASLPLLTLDGAPPCSVDEFSALCREHLAGDDLAAAEALLGDGPSDHPYVTAWRDLETQLRNALARTRAARLGVDPAPHVRPQQGVDSAVDKAVTDAYTRSSPIERERVLDQFRWAAAEAIAGFDAFALDTILAYSVKLRLAERWASLDENQGREQALKIVDQQPAA